jgi:2-polyprenyl-3-methyl-5-hydroxy-6-metoxy-1,4-benzoquinol methylase
MIEIGCGTGDFLAWLQQKGLTVSGVEFADSANRVRYDGPLHVGRMEDLSLPDAAFDAVLLLNVIEHLSDQAAVLGRILRMLAAGSMLLLRCPNSDLFYLGPYKALVEFPKYVLHRVIARRLDDYSAVTFAGLRGRVPS